MQAIQRFIPFLVVAALSALLRAQAPLATPV